MAFKPQIAIFDACVLYPFHLRNILVQAAADRLVDARWTDRIHAEWMRSLALRAPDLSIERLEATRNLLDRALPLAMVCEYEAHIPAIALPDPDDRHVVAAAITAHASLILSWNLRDFPVSELSAHGLMCISPDDFLAGVYDEAADLAVGSLANARRNLRRSRLDPQGFLRILENQGLIQFAMRMKKHLDRL